MKSQVIEQIELKLECGSLVFTPQEVTSLLNIIRVQNQQLEVARQRLGIVLTTKGEK